MRFERLSSCCRLIDPWYIFHDNDALIASIAFHAHADFYTDEATSTSKNSKRAFMWPAPCARPLLVSTSVATPFGRPSKILSPCPKRSSPLVNACKKKAQRHAPYQALDFIVVTIKHQWYPRGRCATVHGRHHHVIFPWDVPTLLCQPASRGTVIVFELLTTTTLPSTNRHPVVARILLEVDVDAISRMCRR